MMEISGFLKNI